MSENNLDFDPSKPFEVIEEKPQEFDPSQPFEVVPENEIDVPQERDPKDDLDQSMAVASLKNPDRTAKALKLASKYNLTSEFAEQNLELLEQEDQKTAVDTNKVFASTPALAKFLSRPENAAVAKDDVEALSKIEGGIKQQSFALGLVNSVKSGFFSLASNLAKAPALTYQEAPGPDWLYEGSSGAIARAEYAAQAGEVPKSLYNNVVTQYLDEKAKAAAPVEMSKSIIESAKAGDYASAGKAFSYQVASNFPQLALLAVSRGAGLPVMFGASAGGKFAENLEKGVAPDLAKSNAFVTGAIEVGVESLGGVGSVGFKESIKQVTKSLGKEGAKQVFKNSLTEIAKSAGVEGVEEFVTSVSQDMVDYGTGVNDKALDGIGQRAFDSFLVGAGSGGVISGSAISVETGYRLFQNKAETVAAQEAYQAIGQAAQESKLKGRLPEKLKEYIGEATQGTAMQDVFIPVQAFETYFQSKNIPPAQAAQQLGIAEKFEAAKENGTDITMPMSEWATQTLNTEHYQGLANDIKFNPEGYTPNEISAQVEALRSEVQQEQKAAEEAAGPEQSTLKVRSEIEKQLREAGLDAKQARANAQIASLSLSNLALVQGLDPLEYYKSRNLSINQVQQMAEAETVLNQERITPRGIKVQPSKVGNELRLNPLPEVDVRGNIQTVGEQTFFNFAMVKTKEDKLNLTSDMIASIEEGAARNGATSAVVSLKKLNFREQSPMADLFRANGYQLEERNGEKFFVKKLEMPRVFNQAQMAPPMFSKLKQTIEQKMGGSQDVKSLKAMLKEIKPEEMKWSGLDELLNKKEKVTKQEVLDVLKANELQIVDVTLGLSSGNGVRYNQETDSWDIYNISTGQVVDPNYASKADAERMIKTQDQNLGGGKTQYEKYTLPGGENYREVLFTLPPRTAAETKFPDSYRDIKNWEKSDRASFKQIAKKDVEENPEFIAKKKEVAKYLKKQFTGMKPKAINELLDKILISTFKPLTKDDLNTDNQEVADKINELGNLYRKLRSPFPTESLYKIRDPYDLGNLVINNDNRPEGGFYTSDQIGKNTFFKTFEEAVTYLEEKSAKTAESRRTDTFKSSHFDQANILAHVRLNDRTDADGKKVLFVEEIQSDWHQAGRKKGYTLSKEDAAKLEERIQQLDEELKPLDPTSEEFNQKYAEYDSLRNQIEAKGSVPDAPFKKTWHEFAFKRILRMAAENGYERVAWTTGEQQAERFDLSKQIDYVQYDVATNTLRAWTLGKDDPAMEQSVPEDRLDEYIGKEAAAKLISAKEKNGVKTLNNADLKIGGEGMKGFYDKILVDFANKFVKKFGGKVGETNINNGLLGSPSKPLTAMYVGPQMSVEQIRKLAAKADARSERALNSFADAIDAGEMMADASLNLTPDAAKLMGGELVIDDRSVKVHSLDITPQLKETALSEGFTLFQGGADFRGQIRFGKDGVNIDLLKNADASTFIHEMGHFYIEEMHKIVQAGTVTNEQFKKDYETLWNFVGAKLGEKLTVEQHEKAAEAYETYFMEGKAPSKELETLFTKLRAWILNAYKLLINKRVELTDDVRGVFDRMLIGFEAKAQVDQEMNLTAPFIADAQTLGMTDAQYEKYLQARQEASKAAENEIVSKLMQDYQKTKTKEYQARRDAIEAEVETELNSMPVYKAMAALQKYQTPYETSLPKELSTNFGSANFKLDKTFMKAKYGDDFQVTMNLPKGLVADNGLAPSELAPLFGFESGEDLVNALMLAEDKQARLKRETDLRMQQRFPDLIVSNQLPEEALKAVHNEQRAKVLRMELEYMAKNDLPALKDIIRRISRRVPSNEAVKQLAVETIAKYQTKDIRPVIFKRAEIKYAKEAGKLLAQGDFEGAFEAKRKELLNFELYRAAVEAKDDVKKTLKDFRKKLAKGDEAIAKSRDTNMVNAARALLAEYGIMRSEKTAAEYLESIQKYEPDTYNGLMTLMGPALSSAGDYESVTYDQFVVLKDSVNALWDLSKTNKEIEIDGKKMSLETVKADLQAKHDEIALQDKSVKLYQQTMDKWGKAKSFILGARAALTRVEHWADALDVKRGGPHRRYIWNPISEATANYRLRKVEVLTKLESILKANEASFTQDPIVAEEFKSEKYPGGFLFRSKSELIMAILHSGNESNLHKLLVGRGWGAVDESGVVDTSQWNAFFQRVTTDGTITKADMDMVQAIWDLNESLKPDAQKAHKAMYGFYFNEITAKEIETPFGKYRGGYMPAKVDINENEDAAIRNEKDEFENNNKSFMFPTTGRGFTKSRVENYAAPLSLEINLISSHVDSVLRFIHIEPRVKEIARLVTDKEFRSSLSRIDQFVAKDMLVPWLQRAAQQKVALPSDDAIGRAIDAAARFLRRNVSAQIMFANVTNTLQQYTGLIVAMSLVKPRYIRNAMVDYIRSPKASVDEIMAKSKWMRSAQGSNLFDVTKSVNDIILNPSAFETFQNFLQRHTYFMQSAVQNQVNTLVWMGAYNQAIENGMTEADAILEGDAAVRKTQGSLSPEDVSRFETGTPTALLFKQFVGYFNMLANLNANELLRIQREMGLKKSAGKAFYLYAMGFMLPAVLSSVIVQLMSGKGLDQDDDDEYLDDALKTFFESQFLTATATVPYAGPFLTSAYNRFNDKAYDDRLSLSPVISTLEGVAGTPYQLYRKLADDADNNKKLTGDVLTLLGTFTGLPVAPVRKPINYLTDVSTGEAQPTGPIDFTRGLVTGRTGNEGQ